MVPRKEVFQSCKQVGRSFDFTATFANGHSGGVSILQAGRAVFRPTAPVAHRSSSSPCFNPASRSGGLSTLLSCTHTLLDGLFQSCKQVGRSFDKRWLH